MSKFATTQHVFILLTLKATSDGCGDSDGGNGGGMFNEGGIVRFRGPTTFSDNIAKVRPCVTAWVYNEHSLCRLCVLAKNAVDKIVVPASFIIFSLLTH